MANESRAPASSDAGLVTLVDSSVLLDVVTEDPTWSEWSEQALSDARDAGRLAINPIVYAEVSVGFERIEDLDDAVAPTDLAREQLPYDAGFAAGKAFVTYRRRGGQRRSPLPDFYIGAHATVRGYRLLTRDPTRFRSYFPSLDLIAPDSPLPRPDSWKRSDL